MSKHKVVAIHQPNFFPWLGYFDKIARSDIFVFLDDVQYPKKGGAWCNRVKLMVAGQARWATATLDRSYHGTRLIREMTFLENNSWREKVLKTLEVNYGQHPHYSDCMSVIGPLLLNPEDNIASYNTHNIVELCRALSLDDNKLKRSSELAHEGRSNDLLCSITRSVGGNVYMCGAGASGYQDESVFVRAGIQLRHQSFCHPVYPQHKAAEFLPGLSIIDAVMNLGWDATAALLE